MDEQPTDNGSGDGSRAGSGPGRPGDRLLNFSWMAIGGPFLAVVLVIFVLVGPESPLYAVVTIPTVVLIIGLTVARITLRVRRAGADRQRRAPDGDQGQSGR